MIDKEKLKKAAQRWMNAWNDRNMEKVMAHYVDDAIFYSPTVVSRWNTPDGKLKGRAAIEKHFRKALEEVPDMHFEFHAILYGTEGVILVYKRETGALAADLVLFNNEGRVKEVRCYYGQ
jgi:hypothetical protein